MIDSLRRLAARIDREWKRAGSKVSLFPAVAARVLSDEQPHRQYNLHSLAGWTLSHHTFPRACNPFGPFGPPAFTVWSDGRFFANVYAYMTPEVVIHDHDFAGAFVNLSGTTIHAKYQFADVERVAPEVQVGQLAVREVEVVGPGDVRRIDPGRGFIHQVWHLDEPTVVLVIRTGPLPAPARRQFQYLHAGFASEVVRDDAMSVSAPERFQYARKMIECLRTANGGGVDYLRLLLRDERPWDAFWHFTDNWRYLRTLGAMEELIRFGARHQGAWFTGVADAGNEIDLFRSIDWPRVRLPEDRIALALLMTFRAWRPIHEWLETLLPGAAPEDRFVDSLRRLGEEGAIPLQLGEEGRAMLSCILKSGGNRGAWRQRVRESFDVGTRGDWAVANAIERTLRAHRLLQPLFVNAR